MRAPNVSIALQNVPRRDLRNRQASRRLSFEAGSRRRVDEIFRSA